MFSKQSYKRLFFFYLLKCILFSWSIVNLKILATDSQWALFLFRISNAKNNFVIASLDLELEQ